ncbi:MAG: ATP-binding protein [Sandaracinaceae bacterium]|nr:ATP-binding protein [Sandaracinaceae bacterium]
MSVRRESDRTEAKRLGRDLARRVGLEPERAAALDVVVHELATNLIEHGQRGELWLRALDGKAIEIAAVDAGPGIQDLERVLHRASATGLPNVARLSQELHVDSRPGGHTYVRAVIRPLADA